MRGFVAGSRVFQFSAMFLALVSIQNTTVQCIHETLHLNFCQTRGMSLQDSKQTSNLYDMCKDRIYLPSICGLFQRLQLPQSFCMAAEVTEH